MRDCLVLVEDSKLGAIRDAIYERLAKREGSHSSIDIEVKQALADFEKHITEQSDEEKIALYIMELAHCSPLFSEAGIKDIVEQFTESKNEEKQATSSSKKVPDESKQTKETELVPYQQGDLPKEESSNVDSPKSEPKTQRAVSDDPSSISSGAIPDIEVANEPRFELPQEDKSNPNMNIWSEVHKTDRQFCKKDHQGMTSINTQYRIMAATRLFGPRGIGWNFEEIERWVEETAPIIINGQLTEHKETIHHVKVSIWFKVGGEKSEPITHFGSCKSMYMAKGGYFVADEEPYKKALSDALGKCLSTIGIGADVYLGEHDDFHVETLTKNEVDSKLELRQIEEEDRIRKRNYG
ncbi:phage protein [Vibrio ishigakensis]|uniref:Phage protein n=1 Tax=Vibrio ishigakensis TaxID=1481914 RepID=A0A0B8PG87_9VIBR|nr:phage protein [Vibrio ishigakensis]